MNYKEILLNKLLPFHAKRIPDNSFGGVFTSLDKDGKVNSTDKNIWGEARALFAYSSACNAYGVKEEYIEICESIFEFLRKCTMEGGKLPFVVSRDGAAKTVKDNLHSECYAALGCACFYKLTKREEVKEAAMLFFDRSMQLYDKMCAGEGYGSMDRFAVHSLVHYASSFMRECDSKYDAYFKKSVKNMIDGGYFRDDLDLLLDYKTKVGEAPEGVANICIPGDSFVAAWVLMSENMSEPDSKEALFAKKILDTATKFRQNDRFGLVPLTYQIDNPESSGEYKFWPQWEALVAYSLAEKLFSEKKYAEYAKETKAALEKYLMNEGKTKFYCDLDENANVIGNGIHGDLFHIPRALLMLDGI